MHSRHPASTFNPAIQGWALNVSPGQWQVCEAGTHLTTTLASTIALIIHDTANQRLAMVNFMVEPTAPQNWTTNYLPSPHADALLTDMWQAFLPPEGEGTAPKLSATVTGGAQVKLGNQLFLGQANTMKAVDWLHQKNIPLAHYDVGLTTIRNIQACASTGKVNIARGVLTATLMAADEAYLARLTNPKQQPTN